MCCVCGIGGVCLCWGVMRQCALCVVYIYGICLCGVMRQSAVWLYMWNAGVNHSWGCKCLCFVICSVCENVQGVIVLIYGLGAGGVSNKNIISKVLIYWQIQWYVKKTFTIDIEKNVPVSKFHIHPWEKTLSIVYYKKWIRSSIYYNLQAWTNSYICIVKQFNDECYPGRKKSECVCRMYNQYYISL